MTRILRLRNGEVWLRNRTLSGIFSEVRSTEIETPVATAALRDGELDVKVRDDGQVVLTAVRGSAELLTPFGTCVVPAPATSTATRGNRCTQPQPGDVGSSVSWTSAVLK